MRYLVVEGLPSKASEWDGYGAIWGSVISVVDCNLLYTFCSTIPILSLLK